MTIYNDREKVLQEQYRRAADDAKSVWHHVTQGYTEPEPILLDVMGSPIIFKNSIIVIQGKAGSHKSRLASLFASTILSIEAGKELIGLTRIEKSAYSLMYVDTERNIRSQLPGAMKQILRDAGLDDNKHHFDLTVIPMIRVERSHRFTILRGFIEQLKVHKERNGRHIVIVLDVISDCVSDFNQLSESYNLIDLMNSTINQEDVTFICIIHENPGSEKARGHLGTELSNKASTVIQITETDTKGTFRIRVLKSRNTSKWDDVFVKYSSDANNLVLIEGTSEIAQAKDRKLDELLKALGSKVGNVIDRPTLMNSLKECIKLSERTLQDKLDMIVSKKISFDHIVLGTGHLIKIKGRPIKYQFVPDVDIQKKEI